MFKAFILAAIAVVIAVLIAPNVEPLVLSATASLIDNSTSRSAPLAQSVAEAVISKASDKTETLSSADAAETLNVADKAAAPTLPEEAASKPVDQSPTESQSDILYRQFETWAAAHKDNVVPVVQTAQVVAAVQKRRDARPVVHRQDVTRRSSRQPPQPVRSAQVQVPATLSAESQWTPHSH
jgi:hypothetical protein